MCRLHLAQNPMQQYQQGAGTTRRCRASTQPGVLLSLRSLYAARKTGMWWRGDPTCSPEERGSGKWRAKTSQPCPPSSSSNDSKVTRDNHKAQPIRSQRWYRQTRSRDGISEVFSPFGGHTADAADTTRKIRNSVNHSFGQST